ncbi:hypothetical protein QBC39DRAFT_397546 [Podospora conica]|nr:hypothetical protein QBC39DRAFT_397546 [Schizothecium conicum]
MARPSGMMCQMKLTLHTPCFLPWFLSISTPRSGNSSAQSPDGSSGQTAPATQPGPRNADEDQVWPERQSRDDDSFRSPTDGRQRESSSSDSEPPDAAAGRSATRFKRRRIQSTSPFRLPPSPTEPEPELDTSPPGSNSDSEPPHAAADRSVAGIEGGRIQPTSSFRPPTSATEPDPELDTSPPENSSPDSEVPHAAPGRFVIGIERCRVQSSFRPPASPTEPEPELNTSPPAPPRRTGGGERAGSFATQIEHCRIQSTSSFGRPTSPTEPEPQLDTMLPTPPRRIRGRERAGSSATRIGRCRLRETNSSKPPTFPAGPSPPGPELDTNKPPKPEPRLGTSLLQNPKHPWRHAYTPVQVFILGIVFGLVVGLALRPWVNQLATRARRMATPQEASIIYFNGTLISAVDRCYNLSIPLDAQLVAPPTARPATIPHGISTSAQPVFELCKLAGIIPHRHDVADFCREFQGAYDAAMPHGPKSTWHSSRTWCDGMAHSSGPSIRSLVENLQWAAKRADERFGPDRDTDGTIPASWDDRISRGLVSHISAGPVQKRLELMVADFQAILDFAREKGSPVAIMVKSVAGVADAFAYETSKKTLVRDAGIATVERIQGLVGSTSSSLAFLTAALERIEATQVGAEDMIQALESLFSQLQRASEAYEADLRTEKWWIIPPSWVTLSRCAMNLFPPGPFVEDPFYAYLELQDALLKWDKIAADIGQASS